MPGKSRPSQPTFGAVGAVDVEEFEVRRLILIIHNAFVHQDFGRPLGNLHGLEQRHIRAAYWQFGGVSAQTHE